jgi:arylsulfatase A-like enzyme
MFAQLRRSILLLAVVVCGTATCSRSEPPFNVLLISIDTLRHDALGCTGGREGISPHLDELARQSVVFEQAIAQAPWTLPSHAALLTSLYPSQLDLGRFGETKPVSPAATRISDVLQRAGFQTFAIVAGGFLLPELGFGQGFDSFDPRGTNMRLTADKFVERLDELDRERPFFAFLHTYDVHKYNPPAEDRAKFVTVTDSALSKLPATRVAEILQDNSSQEIVRAYGDLERKYARELYDAAVHSVDRELGRVFAALRERGLDANTLIIVTSDHGEEFWEHGRTGHGFNLHDENLRVPLFVRDPRRGANRVAAQVRLIDVAPTIAARCSLAAPAHWQGVDLSPLEDGATRDLPAFAESAHLPYKCFRSTERKLVVSLRRPFRPLYELESDPHEAVDRFDPANETHQKMALALKRWIIETAGDTRFRGAGTVTLDENAARELQQLGYTAPGEQVPSDAAPWLRALANEPPNPATPAVR